MARHRRGFTLVELMISLVMGLIVALAAVGLARSATTTFHEQARSSITEMGVRSGAERLRQDLMRISYMSTGNIALDPKVAHRNGDDTPAQRARYPELVNLRGIQINVNGSANPIATSNLLNPDSITITGNLTTDDAYSGQISNGGLCGNGQVVRLDPVGDAAVYTLAGGAAMTDTLFLANAQAAFIPVSGGTFLSQVTDAAGCTHYAPVCNVTVIPGTVAGSWALNVHLTGGLNPRAVLYANAPAGYENPAGLANNCGSSDGGKVSIAPVGRVRWALTPTAVALQPDPSLEAAGLKYDLTRQTLDWAGLPIGGPEVVSEYAVDLKFGITIDNPATPSPNSLAVYDIDSDPGTGDIDATTNGPSSQLAGQRGPQRVRSVRFRVAVRTSVADRQQNLPIATPYIARYCADTVAMATCTKWSRVRTIVSEVALHNQARMFY